MGSAKYHRSNTPHEKLEAVRGKGADRRGRVKAFLSPIGEEALSWLPQTRLRLQLPKSFNYRIC